MRAQGGPQKLRFTILSCTSEDGDGPVRELLYHSPQTRGWVSARFPTYPQEILIKLEHASKIQQIQLLSHEYKIATKVEVFVSTAVAGQETSPTATFKRLGYISFDSNERSNHQARELKSVHVNVPATVIKLVAHRSHVNKLNIYNQIGIVALNLIGEPVAPGPDLPPGGYLQLHPPVTREVPYYNAAAADVADLNLDIHVDTVTAAKIRELARAKDAAVAREDYDEAKRIKAGIDRLKVVGQKIAQLEARKRAAVEKEDYDTAKLIKADIDKLRAAGESAAGATDIHQPGTAAAAAGGMPGSKNKDPDEIFGRVLRTSNTSLTAAAGSVNNKQAYLTDAQADASIVEEQSFSHPAVTDDPSVSGDYYDGAGGGRGSYPGGGRGSYPGGAGTLATSYDERPALGKGRYTPTGAGPENAPGLDGMAPPAAAAAAGSGSDYVCDIPAPDGWPRDLPGPEPLSSKDSKEADSVVEVTGEYVARALFSKNWQLREAALNYISSQVLNSALLADNRDAFKTLSKTALRCMKDKVANVFLASLGLFQSLVGSSTGHAVQVASDNCLPMLLDKLGDNNPKLSSAAKDCIMFLSGVKDADLRASAHLFIKPVKNQSAWRPVLGILTILQDLVPVLGVGKAGGGFELPELMEWVGKCFSSANGEVRSAAVRVTKEVYDLVGPAVRRLLPNDISPKIKEQLDALLGGAMMEEAAPPPPPQPHHVAANSRAAKSARGGGVAPPPPSTGSSARAGGPPPSTASSRSGASAPAKQLPNAKKGGAPAMASLPEPTAASGDDPAPYLEELTQRERQFGKDHPRVAETASNLAILYNQHGDAASALPLYERALAIYEKAYGPDHADVAHTLTDLAVLHLEQGNEAVGRPLLERALVIQEAALGPDHPDVIAIKDVLNS